MNAIANQVIRASGKSVKNGGWPYFDGTFKEYPSFKRKFTTYQANYHQATPQRELAQMFRENCLPDKIAIRIKKAEDMLTAWRILDAIYDNPLAFIKDLMQEIRAVPEFREEDCEKMMEYYMLLQSHIAEADKADVGAMLLIPANIADMTRTLPYAKGKRWRDQLGRIHPLDIGNGFSTFVDRRLEYATTQVANCERLVLPKPIPLGARANRSPSTDRHGSRGDRGGSVSRGNLASRGARVMGISAERKPAGEKKVHFPPPRKFNPDGPWKFPCVARDGCQERHSPTQCEVFKKMTPRRRLEKVEEKQLCKLCFRHLAINKCWAKGKTPNYQIKGCGGEHNHLLHDALMMGKALVIQGVGGDSSQSYLCCEDIRAEVAGKTHRLHTLHDWGATLTLITRDAADRAGLTPIRHSARLVSGLGGKCLESTCFYVVPFMDGCDEIQTLRATGVAQIYSLGASAPPSDIEGRFSLARGWAARLARPAEDADLLIGLDNQRWMPTAQACQQQPHGRRQPQADAVSTRASVHAAGASRGNCSCRSKSGEQGRPGIKRAPHQRGTSAHRT
jgi:hypothetical protein